MISALNPTLIVRVITMAIMLLAGLFAWSTSQEAAMVVWQRIGWAVVALNGLVLLLTFPWVFGAVHALTFAKHWWFPRLDGEWEGEARSNWPRVHTMMQAARNQVEAFNPLCDDLPTNAPEGLTLIHVRIQSHLLGIFIHARVPNTSRISHSLFALPRWCKPSAPELYYIYEQEDADTPEITDSSNHYGAAKVRYYTDTDELRGEYWTQRQGDKGLNTAGRIRFKRVLRK